MEDGRGLFLQVPSLSPSARWGITVGGRSLGHGAVGMATHQPSQPPRHLQEPQQTLEAMLRPKVTTLPGHIQAVYVQNVVKLYAAILQQKEQAADVSAAQEVTQLLVERLPQFVQSADLEVQERVSAAARPPEGSLGGALLWFSHSWPGAGWASLEPLCWGGPRWSHRRSLAKGDGSGRR